MRALRVWVLFLFLAGCVGPAADVGDVGSGAPDAGPSFLTYRGCVEHQGVFVIRSGDFSGRLPAGFTLSGSTPDTAFWTLVAYRCAEVTGDAFTAVDVGEVFGALMVTPPEHLRIDNGSRVGGYAVTLFHAATDARVEAAYDAWGWGDTAVGEVDVVNDLDVPVLREGYAALSAPEGGVEARTVAAGEATPWEGRFVRVFGLDHPFGTEAPQIVGYTDVWVPDRAAMPEGEMTYSNFVWDGFAGSVLPATAVGVGIHWEMESDAVGYHAVFTQLS